MAEYYLHNDTLGLMRVPKSDALTMRRWLPERPVELQAIDTPLNRRWTESTPPFETMANIDYASLLQSLPQTGRIYDGFCYRLIEFDGTTLTFCPGKYFDYLNTCEYLGFELALAITRDLKISGQLGVGNDANLQEIAGELLLDKSLLPQRSAIQPLSFSERSTAFGTATITVIKRSKKPPQFVMNRRSSSLSETPGLLHVIPAGTFQSNFPNDRFHEQEFSFTENILREFIEELIDDRQLRGNTKLFFSRDDMFSETGSAFRRLVCDPGNMDLIYLGTVIDPINLKPEIITVFMIHEAYLQLICGELLNPSWETEGNSIELHDLSESSIQSLLSHELLVPTGRAHLSLVLMHIGFIRERLASI